MSNNRSGPFAVLLAIILTDVGFHLLHLNPDQLSFKFSLLRYAIWIVLFFPLYWSFGKLGNSKTTQNH